MWGREGQAIHPLPSLPPRIDCPAAHRPMSIFEIPVGHSIAENLRTSRTLGSDKCRLEDPTTSNRYGSIMSDQKRGMTLEWADEGEFAEWLATEELEKGIELIVSNVTYSKSPLWREQRILKCSREWMGGRPTQDQSGSGATKERDRKIPSKKTGCRCRLTIKLYQHTETILGKYEREHDHPLGSENLRFTWLTDRTREMVMEMVHTGIDSKTIVSNDLLVAYLAS